jgi:hypothetical protein
MQVDKDDLSEQVGSLANDHGQLSCIPLRPSTEARICYLPKQDLGRRRPNELLVLSGGRTGPLDDNYSPVQTTTSEKRKADDEDDVALGHLAHVFRVLNDEVYSFGGYGECLTAVAMDDMGISVSQLVLKRFLLLLGRVKRERNNAVRVFVQSHCSINKEFWVFCEMLPFRYAALDEWP